MKEQNTSLRYAEADLTEFKAVIESRLAKEQEQLDDLEEQLDDLRENSEDDRADYLDGSFSINEAEMLNEQIIRRKKYILDLENSLLRIHSKSYGICEVTGELIDKRRLMAVPTTTKCVEAKNALAKEIEESSKPKPLAPPTPAIQKESETRKIITRVIRKPGSPTATAATSKKKSYDEEDDDFEFDFDDNIDDVTLGDDLSSFELEDMDEDAGSSNGGEEDGGEDTRSDKGGEDDED